MRHFISRCATFCVQLSPTCDLKKERLEPRLSLRWTIFAHLFFALPNFSGLFSQTSLPLFRPTAQNILLSTLKSVCLLVPSALLLSSPCIIICMRAFHDFLSFVPTLLFPSFYLRPNHVLSYILVFVDNASSPAFVRDPIGAASFTAFFLLPNLIRSVFLTFSRFGRYDTCRICNS